MSQLIALQELYQRPCAVDRHSVIHRSSQATDRRMSLEIAQADPHGGRDHISIRVRSAGREGNVHQAPDFRVDFPVEKRGIIQKIINDLRLFLIFLVDRLQTAVLQQVADDQATAVDGPAVRRIVTGVSICVGRIF